MKWENLKKALNELDEKEYLEKEEKYEQDFVEICDGIYACKTNETGYYYVHTNDGYEHGELSVSDIISLLEELDNTDATEYRKSWK